MSQEQEKTYWNGEPAKANKVRVIVADNPHAPLYWARDLVGQEREAVKVVYNGAAFYLDNETGEGWAKVTLYRGSPRVPHRNLNVERIIR